VLVRGTGGWKRRREGILLLQAKSSTNCPSLKNRFSWVPSSFGLPQNRWCRAPRASGPPAQDPSDIRRHIIPARGGNVSLDDDDAVERTCRSAQDDVLRETGQEVWCEVSSGGDIVVVTRTAFVEVPGQGERNEWLSRNARSHRYCIHEPAVPLLPRLAAT
jgi:hypothetical protein